MVDRLPAPAGAGPRLRTQTTPFASMRHKRLPHRHLPHLPAGWFVNTYPNLNATQWVRVGRGGFLLVSVVNETVAVVVESVGALINKAVAVVIDAIGLVMGAPGAIGSGKGVAGTADSAAGWLRTVALLV